MKSGGLAHKKKNTNIYNGRSPVHNEVLGRGGCLGGKNMAIGSASQGHGYTGLFSTSATVQTKHV